ELVKCQTSEVLVPAHAEMVLECELLPGKRTAEGPFGEFTGYSLGERQREVVKVKAITHRRDAMFQDITVAHLDHMLLSTIPMEANLYRAAKEDGYTAKWGVDATAKPSLGGYTPRHRVPPEVWERLRLEDFLPGS